MNWLLSQVALAVDGRLVGADVALTGVSTDTRAIAAGQLFLALRGQRLGCPDFPPPAVASRPAPLRGARRTRKRLPRPGPRPGGASLG